ncbi:hypothetical protein PFISCL1PPCAC_26365, partial [Pristionchus fissidentatus]
GPFYAVTVLICSCFVIECLSNCYLVMTKLSLVVLLSIIGLLAAKMQNVTVTGVLECKGKYLWGTLVELMEKDTADPDDLLDTTRTSSYGKFTLKGGENEFASITPYIKVTHNCGTSVIPGKVCTRKTKYFVPKQHINGPIYDMKTISMDIFDKGEKEDCKKV